MRGIFYFTNDGHEAIMTYRTTASVHQWFCELMTSGVPSIHRLVRFIDVPMLLYPDVNLLIYLSVLCEINFAGYDDGFAAVTRTDVCYRLA